MAFKGKFLGFLWGFECGLVRFSGGFEGHLGFFTFLRAQGFRGFFKLFIEPDKFWRFF